MLPPPTSRIFLESIFNKTGKYDKLHLNNLKFVMIFAFEAKKNYDLYHLLKIMI